MKRLNLVLTLALPTLLWTACADQRPLLEPEPIGVTSVAAARNPQVVQVAPPTGDVATDRASILAAAEQVRPGGTILFAPGTYVIGTLESYDLLHISVPRITLLGHPAGTTLRGCDPDQIGLATCHGLLLNGGHQSVRHLIFTDLASSVTLGRTPGDPEARVGGYLVEDNVFREVYWGVGVFGDWSQPAVVRNNVFVNSTLAVGVHGSRVHVVDNHIFAPEPTRAPVFGSPFAGIMSSDGYGSPCERNVFARNRIEGVENGLLLEAYDAGLGCRHNILRDNIIVNSREFRPYAPAWPIGLGNFSEFESFEPGLLQHNLVEGNRIVGSEGMGVVLYAAEGNRIVNNTITGITFSRQFDEWLGQGDGSGIWVSPGSRDNRILVNVFADVASYEVVLEGDYNHVATRSQGDTVLDLGTGNRVTGPGSVVNFVAPARPSASRVPAAAVSAEALKRPGRAMMRIGRRSESGSR